MIIATNPECRLQKTSYGNTSVIYDHAIADRKANDDFRIMKYDQGSHQVDQNNFHKILKDLKSGTICEYKDTSGKSHKLKMSPKDVENLLKNMNSVGIYF